MPSVRLLVVATLTAVAALSGPASAQTAPMGAPGAAGGQQRVRLTPGQALARYQAQRKAQLPQMHAALKITPAQQGAWNDFVRDTSLTMDDFVIPTSMPPTTPERVDLIDSYQQTRLDAQKRRNRAVKVFYGKLSPEQKAIMDGKGARAGRPSAIAG